MPKFIPIAPSTTQRKSWQHAPDLAVFKSRGLLPLSLGELSAASANFPLAVVKLQESWQLVAVCGQQVGDNLFIKDGKWLGNYLPEVCRIYPFDVVVNDGKMVVIGDSESGLILDDATGKSFFNEGAEPTEEFKPLLETLRRRAGMIPLLQSSVESLAQAGVLMTFPEKLRQETGINMAGLHMLNEQALNKLDDAAFVKVRKALPLAYALNFSLSQQHILQRLTRLNPPAMAVDDIADVFGDQDDTLKFNF